MESHNMILFLLNNQIILKDTFESDNFSLEKKEESNIIFYVNRLKNQDDSSDDKPADFYEQKITGALIVKVKKDVNKLSDNLLVREALFFDFFESKKIFADFPKAHPVSSLGLFQNNSIVVRDFVENYRDSFRIFLNRKVIAKDEFTYLHDLVKAIAKALKQFHSTSFDMATLKELFKKYLNPSELYVNPLFLQEIPPINKFKLAPVYIQAFWEWVNNDKTKIGTLIDESNYQKQTSQLVHGDFRLPNIIFSLTGKETLIKNNLIKAYNIDLEKPLFIDFEYWHLGDQTWDIVCFLSDLKSSLHLNNIDIYKKAFLLEYYGSTPSDEVVKKIDATEKLFIIQNQYSQLSEDNYIAIIKNLSTII